MGLPRELGINNGNGSCYPQDGSAPATVPKTLTRWVSPAVEGHRATSHIWLEFASPACVGECAAYKKWLDSIPQGPQGLIPNDPNLYSHCKSINDDNVLVVLPGIPDRQVGGYSYLGVDYECTRDMNTAPYIAPARLLEGVPPYYKSSFVYQNKVSVGVGQYKASTLTAKPNELKMKGYRLSMYFSTAKYLTDARYDFIWGQAELGPDNWIGYKTYGHANHFKMNYFVSTDYLLDDQQVYGKFTGKINGCYLNACYVISEELTDCELFDMNVMVGDLPKYWISVGKATDCVLAMNWGNLKLGNAKHSLVRLNQVDFTMLAELDTTYIQMRDETVVAPITCTVIEGKLTRCLLEEGQYNLTKMYAIGSSFYQCVLNLQTLHATNVHMLGMTISGNELRIDGGIVLSNSTITSNGVGAIRYTSIDNNATAILAEGSIIEYSDINDANVILESDAVVVSCSFSDGTVTVKNGAQLEGCYISTSAIVFVEPGTKLVGVDLALKSVWDINDGDPNANIAYTPIQDLDNIDNYGIQIKAIDVDGCIIENGHYDQLTPTAQAEFEEYLATVDSYGNIIAPSQYSQAELETLSQRLWKAKGKLTTDTADELQVLGIVVGCTRRKSWWPIPVPYTSTTVVDPRP